MDAKPAAVKSKKLGGQIVQKTVKTVKKEQPRATPLPQKAKAPVSTEQFTAKPKLRPVTSWGRETSATQGGPQSKHQQELLADIMGSQAKAMIRPQTAATSTLADETRILSKLKYLEKIEQKIEDDLDEFVHKRGDKFKKDKKGVQLTLDMILDASQCDTIDQVSTVSKRYVNLSFYS